MYLLKPLKSDVASSARHRSMSVISDATNFTRKSQRSRRTGIHTTKPPENQHTTISLMSILSNPKVLIALSGTVMGASCQGFLEASLEPYLEETYSLSVTKIGYTFLGLSVPYFFASPFWGYTCDHWVNPKVIQPVGHVFTIIGFIFIGPVGYIPGTVRSRP